jgi:hypothetical protein
MMAGRTRQFRIAVALGLPVAAGLVLLVAGCVDERETPARPAGPAFSHKHHVVEEEIECNVCHKDATKGDKAGMPTLTSCGKCHTGTDEKKKPNALQIKAFGADESPLFSKLTAVSKEVKFSHKIHADGKVKCETCHKGIKSSKEVSSRLRLSMSDCMDCHAKVGVGAGAKDACALCHTSINRDWKPSNHRENWEQLHGRAKEFMGRNSPQRCDLCHTEKSCAECHRSNPPKDHNNFWRERGHGVTATLDRSRCNTCHTQDSCVRCHQSVTPRSHRAGWDSQHCTSCHLPLQRTACITCHKNVNSHAAAPTLPTNAAHRNAGPNDCRNCHVGRLLPHVDNGENCLTCHRR